MAGGNVPSSLAPVFNAAGHAYNIPPAVLAGIASVETNLGANNQTSSTGARGLMQFEPGTAAGLGVNVNDARSEIFGAAKLLTEYGYHQNPSRAIGAYNGGPGNPQMGYAAQVLSEAKRLAPQLGGVGGASAVPGGAPNISGQPGFATVPVSTQTFDQAGYNAARARFIAGQAVAEAGSSANPFNEKGSSSGPNPLLSIQGLLSTTQPNPQDYVSTQTQMVQLAQAHDALTKLAGRPLNLHPALRASTVAGGFLPQGAMYVVGRKDQGRDGQTNPGGPIIANGNGVVVNVLSDPNGFGPRYPVIKFTSGPYAGQTLYFGHTLTNLRPGQQVQSGQVISHTGTSGVGNATVPGWFEIGFAPGGSPGRFGQPTPF